MTIRAADTVRFLMTAAISFSGIASSNALAFTPTCKDIFVGALHRSESLTLQVRNAKDNGNELVDFTIEEISGPSDFIKLQLKDSAGQIHDQFALRIQHGSISAGSFESVSVMRFEYESTILDNRAVSATPKWSVLNMPGSQGWLLQGEVVVLKTSRGVHFFEIQGRGDLVHTVSLITSANPQIRSTTVGWLNSQGGSLRRGVIEVRSDAETQYYDGRLRTIIPRASVVPE